MSETSEIEKPVPSADKDWLADLLRIGHKSSPLLACVFGLILAGQVYNYFWPEPKPEWNCTYEECKALDERDHLFLFDLKRAYPDMVRYYGLKHQIDEDRKGVSEAKDPEVRDKLAKELRDEQRRYARRTTLYLRMKTDAQHEGEAGLPTDEDAIKYGYR
jgi:hypothetical protein